MSIVCSREIHDTICQSSGTQLEEETESLGLRETSTTSLLYNATSTSLQQSSSEFYLVSSFYYLYNTNFTFTTFKLLQYKIQDFLYN